MFCLKRKRKHKSLIHKVLHFFVLTINNKLKIAFILMILGLIGVASLLTVNFPTDQLPDERKSDGPSAGKSVCEPLFLWKLHSQLVLLRILSLLHTEAADMTIGDSLISDRCHDVKPMASPGHLREP